MAKKDDEDYNEGRKKALSRPKRYPASKGTDLASKFMDAGVRGLTDYVVDPLSRTLARTGLTTDEEGKKRGPKYIDGFIAGRRENLGYKKGGSVKSSASRRGDGIAKRGKTKGKMC
jgi:hypothetical protein